MSNVNLIKPAGVQNIINKFCLTIGMIPTSYKLSMTYEEQILAIGNFLEETVIPALNNNAEAVAELQSLYVQLKDYVENYFDKLDIQDEINQKLEEMASSGQLTEVVAQYLKTAGLICFNTKNDLINAENLINGSFVKTFGELDYNDGKGQFYKIRNVVNTDVIDNINIIPLQNFENLVAELIKNYFIEELSAKLEDGKTLMLGDSYGVGQSTPSNTIGWCDNLKDLLNIPDTHFFKLVAGGCGFVGSGSNYYDLLRNNIENIDTNNIKHIYIGSGINDYNADKNTLKNKISEFFTYLKQQFPNCDDIVLFITGYNNALTELGANERTGVLKIIQVYNEATNYGVKILNGSCYCLRNDSLMTNDHVHATEQGYKEIAQNMYNLLKTGNTIFNNGYDYSTADYDSVLTPSNNLTYADDKTLFIRPLFINNSCYLIIPALALLTSSSGNFNTELDGSLEIGNMNCINFKPSIYTLIFKVNVAVYSSTTGKTNFLPANLLIDYTGKVSLKFNGYVSDITSFSIEASQICLPIEYI